MTATIPPLPTLPCAGCGASLPVDPTEPSARCGHCGHATTVPPDLRERARAHAARMATVWADELEARRTELLHRQAARLNGPLVAVIMLFACSVPAWLILAAADLLSHVSVVTQIVLVAGELALFAALVHGFRLMIRAPTVRLVLASGLGACPTCGGPVHLGEQAQSTRCRHCGATLLATPDVQRAFLATATARLGGALTDRDRAELANWDTAQTARVRGMTIPIVPVAVAFVVIAALAIVGGVVAVASTGALSKRGSTPTGWILPVLLGGAAALVYWGVRGVGAAIDAKDQFEHAIGRKLRPLPTAPPRP